MTETERQRKTETERQRKTETGGQTDRQRHRRRAHNTFFLNEIRNVAQHRIKQNKKSILKQFLSFRFK